MRRLTHVLPILDRGLPEYVDGHLCSVFSPCAPGIRRTPDGAVGIFHRDPSHQGRWEKVVAPDPWAPDLPEGLTPRGGG